MVKKYLPLAALTVLGLTSVASAARNTNSSGKPTNGDVCAPSPPAVCYPEDCPPCQRCLGPENFAGNPPVCPKGCNGDFDITVAAAYWSMHQDGMEYAILNAQQQPSLAAPAGTLTPTNNQFNQLAGAEYKHPSSKWNWGFKVGVGYCSACDGWDVQLLWTWFDGKNHNTIDADPVDNLAILPLWSDFATQYANVNTVTTAPVVGATVGDILFATDSEISWKVKLNLVDLELGRDYWVSRYLSVRPFVGLRYVSIKQHTDIFYNGGSFQAASFTFTTPVATSSQPAFNDIVNLENNYRGAGVRGGLGSEWNLGCGWALYGDFAASIVFGKFRVDHDEFIRLASISPHNETNILDTTETFRGSRAILDMGLGIQWSTMFCSCKYGLTAMLGWESHMFFDQNQMWKVSRVGAVGATNTATTGLNANPPTLNNTGDNVITQRRGSLDTAGWTLTLKFDF